MIERIKEQLTTLFTYRNLEGENMMELIGNSAGQIWEYLHTNGEATLTKMKKELDLPGNFAELGLGWLAREGKVSIEKKGAHTKVRLN